MLSTEHIRVYKRNDVVRPVFLSNKISLAKTLIAVYKDHVGSKRGPLKEALSDCEELGYDYKLVRGMAEVLESRAIFRVDAAVPPLTARTRVFTEAAKHVITDDKDRAEILGVVAEKLNVSIEALDASLYADLEDEQSIAEFDEPSSEELHRFYNYVNTVALMAFSRQIKASVNGSDDYLVILAEAIGDAEATKTRSMTSVVIHLKVTNRLNQRGSKVDEFLARLLKADDWSLEAQIVYPSRNKKYHTLSLSKTSHGGLLEKDPEQIEDVIEIKPRAPKKPAYGDIIVLEELAAKKGVTETAVLREIKREGFTYRDLGGVLVLPEKLDGLKDALDNVGSLGEARSILRSHGVRNFMPVLEAMGYQVEWGKPRSSSRVYRL
ncbi:MAG: DUF790 family protein [Candidatus Bathyarchaeota archaeon]|nr:DUF790 family protein [Candidatus Bathyarchaeota archaeon]